MLQLYLNLKEYIVGDPIFDYFKTNYITIIQNLENDILFLNSCKTKPDGHSKIFILSVVIDFINETIEKTKKQLINKLSVKRYLKYVTFIKSLDMLKHELILSIDKGLSFYKWNHVYILHYNRVKIKLNHSSCIRIYEMYFCFFEFNKEVKRLFNKNITI